MRSPQVEQNSHRLHLTLNRFNATRLTPALPREGWRGRLDDRIRNEAAEREFVEAELRAVASVTAGVPRHAAGFMAWFEALRESGPGQGDALFPWLAKNASMAEMQWFLRQEAAGEAGFEDLLALTQVRFPATPKLEMARNYWDEMGRGHERGMHGPMLARVVSQLKLDPRPETTVWEALALSNLMIALASNREFAYHSIGALGVIEMTAPGRVSLVNEGLMRLSVGMEGRKYFALHAGLDVHHSRTWNREVIRPLIEANPEVAMAIAEGALMRLASGARCFARYRAHFGLSAGGRRRASLRASHDLTQSKRHAVPKVERLAPVLDQLQAVS